MRAGAERPAGEAAVVALDFLVPGTGCPEVRASAEDLAPSQDPWTQTSVVSPVREGDGGTRTEATKINCLMRRQNKLTWMLSKGITLSTSVGLIYNHHIS